MDRLLVKSPPLFLCSLFLVSVIGCSRQNPIAPSSAGLATSDAATLTTLSVNRPLSDFLDRQGSTTTFIAPVPDYIGWFSDPQRPPVGLAFVDYAGLEAKWLQDHGGPSLGTQVSGSVIERPLADGRAEVTINLHTTRAQTWAIPFDPGGSFDQLLNNPLLFGHRAPELLADPSLTPGLSTCDMVWVIKNTAPGAPLPDLVAFLTGDLEPGQELVSAAIRSNGSGPLRAAFGVDDGTPGRVVVVQTVLLRASLKGALADTAPAEHVDLHIVGGGRPKT